MIPKKDNPPQILLTMKPTDQNIEDTNNSRRAYN